jgi:Skp family chaperone for outer membrane proteins
MEEKMKSLVAAVFAAGLACSATADVRIGVIDMMSLIKEHPSYEINKKLLASTEKTYQEKIEAQKKALEAIESEGRKLAESYRNPMLSAQAKEKIEKDISEVQRRYLSAQQNLREEAMRSQKELADHEARLLKVQLDDIKEKVAEFAEKYKFDLIVDKSAAVYSKKSRDLTKEVAYKYFKNASSEGTKESKK